MMNPNHIRKDAFHLLDRALALVKPAADQGRGLTQAELRQVRFLRTQADGMLAQIGDSVDSITAAPAVPEAMAGATYSATADKIASTASAAGRDLSAKEQADVAGLRAKAESANETARLAAELGAILDAAATATPRSYGAVFAG